MREAPDGATRRGLRLVPSEDGIAHLVVAMRIP